MPAVVFFICVWRKGEKVKHEQSVLCHPLKGVRAYLLELLLGEPLAVFRDFWWRYGHGRGGDGRRGLLYGFNVWISDF